MKKIIIVLVLLFISAGIFAQSVRDMNGYDWVQMTSMEKEKFCTGFLCGADTFRFLMEDMPEPEDAEVSDSLAFLYHWMSYNGTSGDMVILIDRFYNQTTNEVDILSFPVQEIILVVYEKDWWTE